MDQQLVMLLQAFAREIGAVLINVRGSTLFSKWVGESERLTSALFSLAAKLSAANLTTILFVDEVCTCSLQHHRCAHHHHHYV